MKRLVPLLCCPALLGSLGGCGKADSLMPLDQGRSWTYRIFNGVLHYVEPVEVKGVVPVGPVEGAVLTGPMGTSHLAWQNETLYASRLANAGFYPPIPLVIDNGGKKASLNWRGSVEAFGEVRDARATFTQERVPVLQGGSRYFVTKTEMKIVAVEGGKPPTEMELTTSFRTGVGIVEQVQRTNRDHIVTLRLLD